VSDGHVNSRIVKFTKDGTFLEEWKQFGEASGIFIMPDDTLYVTDWQDRKAIFIGSAKDGSIKETSPAARRQTGPSSGARTSNRARGRAV
jgi:hypothetical protein